MCIVYIIVFRDVYTIIHGYVYRIINMDVYGAVSTVNRFVYSSVNRDAWVYHYKLGLSKYRHVYQEKNYELN